MTFETYTIYLLALAVFFITPPDNSQLLMISNSMRFGVRRSVATVAGDLTANILQMIAAAFGLAALITTSPMAFMVIKWLGVLYLVGLGVRLIFHTAKAEVEQGNARGQAGHLFTQGFLNSSANPYAIVFFAALFPQFIDPSVEIWPQLIVLGVTYLIVDGTILVFWGLLSERVIAKVGGLSSGWINATCGVMMIGAAIILGLSNLEVR
jgi:homoserine/homoserine lactone efflux protein